MILYTVIITIEPTRSRTPINRSEADRTIRYAIGPYSRPQYYKEIAQGLKPRTSVRNFLFQKFAIEERVR